MDSTIRYDAHCHIFTLEFAIKEVKHMMLDMLLGRYPLKEPKAKQLRGKSTDRWYELKKLLRWLYELARAAGTNEKENLNFLQKEAKYLYPNDSFRIIPLMMDIFYIYAYNLKKNQDSSNELNKSSRLLNTDEFQQCWDEVLNDLKAYILKKEVKKNILTDNEIIQKVYALKLLENERDISEIVSLKAKVRKARGDFDYYHTDGFCFHLNNLMSLVSERKGELLPFIAIDPRRPRMIDDVLTGKFFEGNSHFYGVKLYPRLGYHPQCKPLWPLYEYCSYKGIPITYHCGMSGFPPGTSWRWARYGNPANFELIIKTFPKLRINFAHMGSSDPNHTWEKTVLDLVNRYPNVYTDLSCYTNENELTRMKSYWDNSEALRNRLLFGTDFDLIYIVEKGISIKQYYMNFQKVFGLASLDRMMIDNPARFLGDVLK